MRKQLGDAACWGLPAGEGRSFLEDPAEEELGEENSDLELILCEENSDLELVLCVAWKEPRFGFGFHSCDILFSGFFLRVTVLSLP